MITRTIGLRYPQRCLASHINMIRAGPPTWTKHPILSLQHALTPYSQAERDGFQRSQWFLKEGSGYRMIQATKPQTAGYGLHDSPVGLLAWIYEKLHDWTDDYPWTDVRTNLSILPSSFLDTPLQEKKEEKKNKNFTDMDPPSRVGFYRTKS